MIRRGLLRSSPERAFEALYRRHVRDVYGYSLAILDRQADAEDATQTTFMNAYRALERGERPRDPGKWLRTIALNVCREHYRRSSRRPVELSLEEDAGNLVLDPPTPEVGDLMRGLSALPFNQRAALVMREFEGRSMNEIAVKLEITSSAVEALLFRARRALREQLEGSLTCMEAEQAISRQLDRALPRPERGPLRAHLRECPECASLARRLRAQRHAVRSLAMLLPLPESLKLWKLAGTGSTGTPAAAAGPLLAKVAVVVAAGAATVGGGYAALGSRDARATRPVLARKGAGAVALAGAASGQPGRAGSPSHPAAPPVATRAQRRDRARAHAAIAASGRAATRRSGHASGAGPLAPQDSGRLGTRQHQSQPHAGGRSRARSSVAPGRAGKPALSRSHSSGQAKQGSTRRLKPTRSPRTPSGAKTRSSAKTTPGSAVAKPATQAAGRGRPAL